MAAQRRVIKVLISSPSDVVAERRIVESVIAELNETLGSRLGVFLEPITWETSVTPAMGARAQEIINTQVGHDYDIFVGILWMRYGTPTGSYGSGTEEEFSLAYERSLTSQKPRILFYFSNVPLPPFEFDSAQYESVKAFRQSVKDKGMYSVYDSTEEFLTKARRDLTRTTLDIIELDASSKDHIENSNIDDSKDVSDLEQHLLDLAHFTTLVAFYARRMTVISSQMMESLTEGLAFLQKADDDHVANLIIELLADRIEEMTNALESDSLRDANYMGLLYDSFNRIVTLPISEEIRDMLKGTAERLAKLNATRAAEAPILKVFEEKFDAFPSISLKFERAKIRALKALTKAMVLKESESPTFDLKSSHKE